MSLCSACSSLDPSGALRQAQAARTTEQQSYKDQVQVEGWYSQARDVFISASACQLCRLVVRGWKAWRPRLVQLAIMNADFDSKNPPGDLYDHIEDIYSNTEVHVGVSKRRRFCSGGQKYSFILTVSCHFAFNISTYVHDKLVAEFRITHPAEKHGFIDHDDIDMGMAVDKNPTSASAVNTAKTWLDTCLTKHEYCLSQNQATTLPFRYLDVNDGEYSDFIFLRDGDGDVESDQRYVALSHCWGTSQQFCTTTTNLQTHREGILIDRLPQTFKDAIQVVRELGLRFLWIDSLCIIQDDIEDWRRESEKMTEVYRNAHFVLAASRSTSDSEGFLAPRTRPEHVELGVNSGVHLILELLPCSLRQPTRSAHPFDSDPLSHRAWCLQERYLARRILHYGSQQLFWECGEIRAAEDGDFTTVDGDQLSSILQSAAIKDTVFTRPLKGGHFNYADWYTMIEDYTGRDITKDSDRLRALSGLARALETRTEDKYLVGLWLGGLLEGLMWVPASSDHVSHPTNSSFPSWSWVSAKRQVQFPIYSWYQQRALWKGSKARFEPLAAYTSQSFDANSLDLCLHAPVLPVRRFEQRGQTPPDSGSRFGLAPERSPVSDWTFYFQCDDVDGKTREFGIDGSLVMDVSVVVKKEKYGLYVEDLYIMFLTRLPFVLKFDFLEHRFGLLVKKNETTDRYKRVGFIDGCLIDKGLSGSWISLLPRGQKSNSPTIYAFKRDFKEGDMVSKGSELDFNSLAPDPLRLHKQHVSLI
ncbi:heterokaryon incompatibility protein-domain-containing protein [Hypoxylon sp. FL1284]|nr:heterokaryon incompatibility protein-domain-containing protein [Hypoxylon sp. FL1284]